MVPGLMTSSLVSSLPEKTRSVVGHPELDWMYLSVDCPLIHQWLWQGPAVTEQDMLHRLRHVLCVKARPHRRKGEFSRLHTHRCRLWALPGIFLNAALEECTISCGNLCNLERQQYVCVLSVDVHWEGSMHVQNVMAVFAISLNFIPTFLLCLCIYGH